MNGSQAGPEARTGLPPWGCGELPAPPSTEGLRILAVIGPGAIALGAALGSGEWLIGPATFVKYGLTLLWVTLVAAVFQTLFNTEIVRYTLYTGEPAFTGFMRTRPGARFWAWVYAILFFLQSGWPGWAGASAGALFYLAWGRLPEAGDARAVYLLGVAAFALCVGVLVFGGRRIERSLEILNWILVTSILVVVAALCLIFAPPERWLAAASGFFGFDPATRSFRLLPQGADWFLIGAFAAYSGAGGLINVAISNWCRDKGYGMGGVVGYIPAAVGGRKVNLPHTGTVFEAGPEALPRWRGWWRIVQADQWGLFFSGALLGMALPAILYTAALPPATEVRGLAMAAALSRALAERGGAMAAVAVALIGVWILVKAQLDILEGLVRSVTDILWSGSAWARAWRGGDVRVVYYGVLAAVVAWGMIALSLTPPYILLQLGANVAGVALVLGSLHILRVNTTLLPPPLRPPLWRRLALVGMALFYFAFVWLWLMGDLVPDPDKGFLLRGLRSLLG
jgi:hypothetical protein